MRKKLLQKFLFSQVMNPGLSPKYFYHRNSTYLSVYFRYNTKHDGTQKNLPSSRLNEKLIRFVRLDLLNVRNFSSVSNSNIKRQLQWSHFTCSPPLNTIFNQPINLELKSSKSNSKNCLLSTTASSFKQKSFGSAIRKSASLGTSWFLF